MADEAWIRARTTKEFANKLINTARDRGTSMQETLLRLASEWLEGPAAASPQNSPIAKSPRNAEWHARLDTILNFGSKEDVTGIQANLRWGAESVEKRRGATKSRAAS